MGPSLRFCVRSLAAGGFLAGAVVASGLLWSQIEAARDSPASLRQALAMETHVALASNADHWERLSELDFVHTEESLREVVRADPGRISGWIQLGLLAEQDGDLSTAERDFQIATRIDRRYLPAWTLANYYFRRGRQDQFWEWARVAVSWAYDDLAPILSLAGRFEQNPGIVLARLGGGARLEREFLTYLIGRRRLEAAQSVATRLAARHDPSDLPRFATLAHWQLGSGHADAALAAWNLAHSPPLDPVHGPFLYNPDLRLPPSGEGFDWALYPASLCPGEEGRWSPGQLQFSFSGRQPDQCVLLAQTLILSLGRRYRFRFESRADGRSPPLGLDWDLAASGGAPEPLGGFPEQSGFRRDSGSVAPAREAWTGYERVLPRAPALSARPSLVHLRLVYHRPLGAVNYEGSVWLRDLRLEML